MKLIQRTLDPGWLHKAAANFQYEISNGCFRIIMYLFVMIRSLSICIFMLCCLPPRVVVGQNRADTVIRKSYLDSLKVAQVELIAERYRMSAEAFVDSISERRDTLAGDSCWIKDRMDKGARLIRRQILTMDPRTKKEKEGIDTWFDWRGRLEFEDRYVFVRDPDSTNWEVDPWLFVHRSYERRVYDGSDRIVLRVVTDLLRRKTIRMTYTYDAYGRQSMKVDEIPQQSFWDGYDLLTGFGEN